MLKKLVILFIVAIIVGLGIYFTLERKEPAIKESTTIQTDPDKKICDGKGNCTTEAEYQEYLNAPDYLCNYYQKSIWKESERAYGKKQYKYTEEKLKKIKALKDEGKSLCDAGKLKEGEAKLEEAIKIISFTMLN
tara:strand:+ start:98 stop:502 length:405 start_codon:yes stop_codon:yes gene_type:complete